MLLPRSGSGERFVGEKVGEGCWLDAEQYLAVVLLKYMAELKPPAGIGCATCGEQHVQCSVMQCRHSAKDNSNNLLILI